MLSIMAEVAIVFGICLLSTGISALLPFSFPASVIGMLLLLVLLLCRIVQTQHIQRISGFFVTNMALFFIPSCIGIVEHWDTLSAFLLPFFIITTITTPLVYLITAWVIQLAMRKRRRKEGSHG